MPEPSSQGGMAAVALGSNLPSRFGDRAANLREALRRLGTLGVLVSASSFHDTAPEGFTEQGRFLNAAALLRTRLPPGALLGELLAVEHSMGRRRADVPPKGPRVIDLDLLLFDKLVLREEALTLPHPAMAERLFVLEPLAEIAPHWMHPVLCRSVRDLLQHCRTRRAPPVPA